MATAASINARLLLLQFGDGESPEQFATKCSINSDRGVTRSAQTTAEMDFDCDDPTLPGNEVTTVDGFAHSVSGDGRLKAADQDFFDDWFESGEAKNCRIKVSATGAKMYEGAFVLETFEVKGGATGSITCSISLKSTGPVTSSTVS